jgi:hypothetical protein
MEGEPDGERPQGPCLSTIPPVISDMYYLALHSVFESSLVILANSEPPPESLKVRVPLWRNYSFLSSDKILAIGPASIYLIAPI